MMKSKKLTATLLIVFICQMAVLGTRFYIHASVHELKKDSQAKSKGDPEAGLKIIEYFNFDCPACRKASMILSAYMESFPQEIYVEHNFHPFERRIHGIRSSVYAECAAKQNAYWAFHDSLFDTQDLWRKETEPDEYFGNIARDLGLNMDKFSACVDDPLVEKGILEGKRAAKLKGIRATPTFFVNGKMLVGASAIIKRLDEEFPAGANETD